MNAPITRAKPRPRRIAADEAHAWARNLRLKNTVAKFILCMLTQYVDGDGICFVSINSLAEDTELSTQTIRTRLAWLEEIGAIARTPQWVDEFGHRNGAGKGRRTSDNIRLMVDLNQEQLEDRAFGEKVRDETDEAPDTEEFDPQKVTVSADSRPSSCPSALPSSRPYDSVEGLTPEPEPEPESPPTPSGGVSENENDQDEVLTEPEHFSEFWRGYPGHEVMSRYRALEIFVTMKPEDQIHARAAALAHAEMLAKLKRRPKDAHKWLAEKGWQEYPQAKIPSTRPISEKRLIRGAELAAVTVGLQIAGLRPLSIISTTSEETGKPTDSAFWARVVGPDLLALAEFGRKDPASRHLVTEGSKEFAAWRERLQAWFGGEIDGDRIWLEPFDPNIHSLPGSHPDFRLRKVTRGFRVPWKWPPRKDGTISSDALVNEGER
jgi:hypothetical protein